MAIIQNDKGINKLSEQNVEDLYKVNPTADPDIGKLYNAGIFDKEPTISDISSGFQSPTFQQDISQDMFNYDLTPRQERDIRRGVLSQFQGEIDASRNAYANLLTEVKLQGKGRLGEDTARQSSRGLLGSDFGAAQTEGVRSYNLSEEQKVLAEQAAALAGIQSEAARLAQTEIQNRRASKQQGSQAYLEYLNTAEERKSQRLETLANALINQNIDPSSLGAKELDKIAKNAGLTSADIINSYLGKKSEAEQAEAERQAQLAKDMSFNLSEGQARYQYNPETGQTELVAERAKTYKPENGGGSGLGTGSLYDRLDFRTANAVIKEADKFGSSPIVKKYNEVVSAANFVNAVDPNTQNPASHQAVIYNFAKMLDPDSVVREGEYATVKKYSQSLFSKYKGELNQAISGKGFLSPEAIKAIQKETQNRVSAYQPQYDNIKNQYKSRINQVAGADVGDMVLLDYEEGYTQPQYGNDIRSVVESAGYDYEALKADGYSDEEIQAQFQ